MSRRGDIHLKGVTHLMILNLRGRREECTGMRLSTPWMTCSLTCLSRLALSRCLLSSLIVEPFMLSSMSISSSATIKDKMSKARKVNADQINKVIKKLSPRIAELSPTVQRKHLWLNNTLRGSQLAGTFIAFMGQG